MTAPRIVTAVAAVLLAGASLVGCSSGSSKVVNTPTTTATTSSSPASSSPAGASSSGSSQPSITVTPASNLKAQQVVHVTGTGFTPKEALQVVECAQKGTSTGPGDCNLTAMVSATSDANGAVATDLTVVQGPFGANKIVCSAQQACLVSVTQASLSPTEEADATIQFATS